MAEIYRSQNKPQGAIGRRLLGSALPIAGSIVGGIYGGPAGAAIGGGLGSTIGGKISGESNAKAINSGIENGISSYGGSAMKSNSPGAGSPLDLIQGGFTGPNGSQTVAAPPSTPASASGRRMQALQQDPQVQIQQGLLALQQLPVDDPLRKQYTGPLIQAQMMGGQNGSYRSA